MASLDELNRVLKEAVGNDAYINVNAEDDLTLDGHFTVRQLEHVVLVLQIYRRLTQQPAER